MKVILSGGGTGGHIYPALAIAAQIKKTRSDAEIVFVGTEAGLEKDIVPRYGYEIRFISVEGFKRSLSLNTVHSAMRLLVGLKDAYKLLTELQPDLVIGTGGYVCGPIVFLAAMRGIPTVIQEQNAMPGVTNKILARYVKRVFLGYREAEKYFGGDSIKVFTGNPVRNEVMRCKRVEAIEALGLDPDKLTILVSGGSRGAISINNAMLYVEDALAGRADVQVLHATGDANYEKFIGELSKTAKDADNIIVKPYLHDMPMALAAADLAVFRAGAIGLAELTVRGVPAVLIPYPFATANHQEFNARALEAAGAAKMLLDKSLTGESLLAELEHLLLHPDQLQKMKEAARSVGRPNAVKEITQQALQLVKK